MPTGHIALILFQREQIWGAIDENKQIWMMKTAHIYYFNEEFCFSGKAI